MATYNGLVTRAGDQAISALKQAEDIAVSAVSSVSEVVGSFMPALPPLPFADRLPAPERVVRTTFGFAERLLEAQKSYALNVIEALAPITSKVTPTKKAQKTSSKTKS